MFNYLRDRLWRKIQGWTGKHLSKAGKEIMVKSVAQAFPTSYIFGGRNGEHDKLLLLVGVKSVPRSWNYLDEVGAVDGP